MLRLIILVLFSYIFYRTLKLILLPPSKNEMKVETFPGTGPTPEDEMVKDPYCNTYISKKGAITARMNGETFYFCCKECRESFHKKITH